MTSRTMTLNDREYRELAAALELMIDHCDVFVANGPANTFLERRQTCQAILKKLRFGESAVVAARSLKPANGGQQAAGAGRQGRSSG